MDQLKTTQEDYKRNKSQRKAKKEWQYEILEKNNGKTEV